MGRVNRKNMNPISKIINIYKSLEGVKRYLPQIIYFNFHYLPFHQAIQLPIFLYKPIFRKIGGGVKIHGNIYCGMIRLGQKMIGVSDGDGFVWENDGHVIFNGRCILGAGSKMAVFNTGIVSFGNHFCATDNMKLVCGKEITFDDEVLIGREATIMDTNQHQLSSPDGTQVGTPVAPIHIGEATWCGFGCTILPGTNIPSRCVVASKSLLNKKYNVPSYSLLAGCPAVKKADGVWRDPQNDKIDYDNI